MKLKAISKWKTQSVMELRNYERSEEPLDEIFSLYFEPKSHMVQAVHELAI